MLDEFGPTPASIGAVAQQQTRGFRELEYLMPSSAPHLDNATLFVIACTCAVRLLLLPDIPFLRFGSTLGKISLFPPLSLSGIPILSPGEGFQASCNFFLSSPFCLPGGGSSARPSAPAISVPCFPGLGGASFFLEKGGAPCQKHIPRIHQSLGARMQEC